MVYRPITTSLIFHISVFNDGMSHEFFLSYLEKIWYKAVMDWFKVLSRPFLEGLGKITKCLCKDSQAPVRDFNLGPPEYEAGVLMHSVETFGFCGKKSLWFFNLMWNVHIRSWRKSSFEFAPQNPGALFFVE